MIQVAVSRIQAIARDILLIELKAPDAQSLPGAAPGAHIDLHLPNGQIRQYSLTNAQGQLRQICYQIAVARDANSRGGSNWVHDKLRLGSVLQVSEPRNLFPLDHSVDKKVLFIGAGIGITPVFAMVNAVKTTDLDWTLMACARSASRLAFLEELSALDQSRVHFPAGSVRMERFKAQAQAQDCSENSPFELVLATSGQSVQVAATESPLEALERIGVDHPFSCREGLCGTCEVSIIEGLADHRDNVLDAEDRSCGQRFIPCVSRCVGNRLVIHL